MPVLLATTKNICIIYRSKKCELDHIFYNYEVMMNKLKNTPWLYYSRFRNTTATDINLIQNAKDCISSLYEISTRTELMISSAYNLLFNHIPEELSKWMAKAACTETDLFGDYALISKASVEHKLDFLRMTESPISSLSRLSGVSIFEIVGNLERATRSESEFVSHLINTSTPTLLTCLENLLQIKLTADSDLSPPIKEDSINRFTAYHLASAGCSKSLNQEITTLHYKTLSEFYVPHQTKSFKKMRSLIPLLSDKELSGYIMLMLALYTICCRVLMNKTASSRHYDTKFIPKKISNILAVGVYIVCSKLNVNYQNCFIKSRKLYNFPSFDNFYAILQMYVSKQAEPVACLGCNTPYLDLKDPKCTEEYLAVIPCPKCKKKTEYDINEN